MSLKGLYGWAIAVTLIGAAAASWVGPLPAAPLSLLAGAVAVTIPFATWHWMLLRRRPVWVYLVAFSAKLAVLAGGFVWMGRSGGVHNGAFVIGMALVLAGAFCFGLEMSRAMTTADRQEGRGA